MPLNFVNINQFFLYFKIFKLKEIEGKATNIPYKRHAVYIHCPFLFVTLHAIQKRNSTIKPSSRLKSIASSKNPKTSFHETDSIYLVYPEGQQQNRGKVQTAENGGTMRPGREDQSKRIEGARWEGRQRRSLK